MSSYQIIGLLFAGVGTASLIALLVDGLRFKTLDLDFLPIARPLVLISRLLIAALFFYSGFVKINDYVGFGYKLEEYFLVFGEAWPALRGFFDFFVPLAEVLAWGIAVFEVALAVAILLGWRMRLTTWLALLMMVFFTFLTGWSHVTGSVTDCGCFGDALKIAPWESFVKDIILTGMLIPIFLTRKYIFAFPKDRFANWALAGTVVLSLAYSWYCHQHLPVIDYRAYKVGVDLKTCTTVMGPEGYPKCKDWDPFFLKSEEEFPLFEGNTLMIVVYDFEETTDEALKESVALANSLQGSGIKVACANASGSETMARYQAQYQFPYPIVILDQTVLKTIIRSHPGYVLLKDGVVMEKWHYNDIPDKEALEGKL
jgi:uncharacterized membrane protein YphA (DoxX/SURF4 family)